MWLPLGSGGPGAQALLSLVQTCCELIRVISPGHSEKENQGTQGVGWEAESLSINETPNLLLFERVLEVFF